MRRSLVLRVALGCLVPAMLAGAQSPAPLQVSLYDLDRPEQRVGACSLALGAGTDELVVACRHTLAGSPRGTLVIWPAVSGAPSVHRLELEAGALRAGLRLSPEELDAVAAGRFEVRLATAERPLGAAVSMLADPVFSSGFETGSTCTDWSHTANPEWCDGLDNNCDGATDEGNPGGGGSCTTGLPGVCSSGTLACSGGALSCVADQSPSAEFCNGLDDDCDGATDEGNPGGGGSCTTGLPGVCSSGTLACSGGALSCVADQSPSVEFCNGLDDDCDGATDEGNPGGGGSCTTGLPGVCSSGTLACSGGALSCVADQSPSVEFCNGLDDDCDGATDEGNPGGGGSCTTGLPGVCSSGTLACSGGALSCVADQSPSAEFCNGLDDDCDGATDEGTSQSCYSGPPLTAGIGECHSGTQYCTGGAYGSCVGEVTPSIEVCNGLDDDCDGATDEGCT